MAFDTHCHIYEEEFDIDIDSVIENMHNNNVIGAILPGFSTSTNVKALKLAQKHAFLYPAVGIHPDQVTVYQEEDFNILVDTIKNNKVYAIGECGLDYHYEPETRDAQLVLFERQIKLSLEFDLPLIIHSRDAIQDTYDLLEKYKGVKFVMHCYSGSLEMAKRFIALGGMISLGGPVTFKNSVNPKEVASNIPLDKLMVETDSPYMAPAPNRGKRNEPAYVNLVIDEIARLRCMERKELEQILDINSKTFFRIGE